MTHFAIIWGRVSKSRRATIRMGQSRKSVTPVVIRAAL